MFIVKKEIRENKNLSRIIERDSSSAKVEANLNTDSISTGTDGLQKE